MAVIGGELGFDGRKRRGRCFGHILNLSARALLFGSNPEAFENQLSGAAALSETEHEVIVISYKIIKHTLQSYTAGFRRIYGRIDSTDNTKILIFFSAW
jgi:hypothetical protein